MRGDDDLAGVLLDEQRVTRRALGRSSIVVGSSASTRSGRRMSTAPIASSCFCPPERLCAGASRRWASPWSASHPSTRSAICTRESPVPRSEKARSSCTVGMMICMSGSVNTNPTRRRSARGAAAGSIPCTRTVPETGRTSPSSTRSSVDLPEPFTPITATRRASRSSETSSRMRVSPASTLTWARWTPAAAGPAGSGPAGRLGCLRSLIARPPRAAPRPGRRRSTRRRGRACRPGRRSARAE